jgi:hypothetical protein
MYAKSKDFDVQNDYGKMMKNYLAIIILLIGSGSFELWAELRTNSLP